MKRVYVAGPYDDDNVISVLNNIRRSIETAAYLMREGFAVYCPFLDFQIALTSSGPTLRKQDYQRNSMAFVETCDFILVLSKWEDSGGTKREIARAEELQIPVYYSIYDFHAGVTP